MVKSNGRPTARQVRKVITGDLRHRVAELEREVQECRQVNLRNAELLDLVQQLLLPAASGDRDALEKAIAEFRAAL